MAKKRNIAHFSNLAVTSYDKTYRAIFSQANEEVDRLGRINHAMRALERRLLDVDAIERMDVAQQLTLFEILSRSQQVSIRNVTGFASILRQVRSIVSVHDGLKDADILEHDPPTEEFDFETSGRLLESELDDYEIDE